MKKMILREDIRFIAVKDMADSRKLHYYILMPSGRREYAFTRKFNKLCYQICKSAPRINDIICGRSDNGEFMRLVKYLNYMMPYLVECYDLGYRKAGRGRMAA